MVCQAYFFQLKKAVYKKIIYSFETNFLKVIKILL